MSTGNRQFCRNHGLKTKRQDNIGVDSDAAKNAAQVTPGTAGAMKKIMKNNTMTHVWRADNLPEKLLIEGILAQEGIESEVESPKFSAQSLCQEHGPWDFYVPDEKKYEVERLLGELLPDRTVSTEVKRSKVNVKKAWAWFVILFGSAMVALIVYMAANL